MNLQMEAEWIGNRCIYLYLWSPGPSQWAKHHASSFGGVEFEWYFW